MGDVGFIRRVWRYHRLPGTEVASLQGRGGHPFLRELIVSFGAFGYGALFGIEADQQGTFLAVRHQRENDSSV
jgi:hypothetical protein